MDSTKEHLLELIAAELCGEILSEEERLLLEKWKNDPKNRDLYTYYRSLFRDRDRLELWEKIKIRQEIPEEIFRKRKPPKVRFLSFMKYAAILIPVIVIASWMLRRTANNTPHQTTLFTHHDVAPGKPQARLCLGNGEEISLTDSSMSIENHRNIQVEKGGRLEYAPDSSRQPQKAVYHTLVVERGAEFQLVLPDGTKVWLNSDSELKYPDIFNEDSRKVYLKGEAYFEVKHQDRQPFLVEAGDYHIRVMGTEFNVSNYREDAEVITTLVQGKVAYSTGKKKGQLQPGQQCVYRKQTGTATVRNVEVGQFISWKNGLFVFEGIRIADLAKQISRWYNIEIACPDESTGEIRFTGAMERSKPVSYILRLLNETNTIDCRLENNVLIFKRK